MIVTKKYINDLREKSLLHIPQKTEKQILEKFSNDIEIDNDGYLHQYTEQDVWEQIRKMIKEQ